MTIRAIVPLMFLATISFVSCFPQLKHKLKCNKMVSPQRLFKFHYPATRSSSTSLVQKGIFKNVVYIYVGKCNGY